MLQRWRWLTLPVLLLCSWLLLAGAALAADEALQGRVEWVYDGDTLKVEGIGKVRLIGIDTPEKDASERDKSYRRHGLSRKVLREAAQQATAYSIRHAKGRMVTLTFDRDRTDRFGRSLAYVTLPDGRLLNRELLREGLALVYRRFDFRLKDDFLAAEADARQAGRGVWGE